MAAPTFLHERAGGVDDPGALEPMGYRLCEGIAAGLRTAGAPLLVWATLCAPAAAVGQDAAPAVVAEEPDHAVAEVHRVLRRARDREAPPPPESALELAPVARAGLPLLIEVLEGRKVPAIGEERAQGLSEVQEAIILHTLAALERAAVLAEVQEMLARGRTPASRDAAVRVIGAVGRALDVPMLFELCVAPGEKELSEHLTKSFRVAVGELVRRDPEALLQVDRLWSYQPEHLLVPMLEGLGEARDPRSLELLDEILVRHEKFLVTILAQIQRIGPSSSLDVNDQLASRLRHELDPSRPGCRAAVFALATLRDYESVPTLIDLLAGDSAGIAQDAHHALRELTGLELRLDVELWDSWYLSEMAWIDEHSSDVLRKLDSPLHADVAAAIGELARRRLYNDTWALELVPLLRHNAPSVRTLTARALAALRSPYVVEGLIDALEDSDRDVQAAAHRALRATTRLNLPQDAEAWRTALLDTRT